MGWHVLSEGATRGEFWRSLMNALETRRRKDQSRVFSVQRNCFLNRTEGIEGLRSKTQQNLMLFQAHHCEVHHCKNTILPGKAFAQRARSIDLGSLASKHSKHAWFHLPLTEYVNMSLCRKISQAVDQQQ